MSEIINLRLARKAKARAVAADKAAANRAAFGRTKTQKASDEATTERLTRTLDGARRETE